MKQTNEIDIHDNIVCDTSFLSIVKITGADAKTFLQGQFSNDVNLLTENNSQLSSYNSPKGRLYASFRLLKSGRDFLMLLPSEVTESIIKRLRMFIMRSNVNIENISDNWKSIGLSGFSITSEINQAPQEANNVLTNKGTTYISLPGVTKRLLALGPEESIKQLTNRLTEKNLLVNANHWKRLDIHAGLPNIYTATQESFVAQMVNLQFINGLSFTKGCYPGQEVIARMRYLGKLKKRMYRITINSDIAPNPGENLYLGGNSQSIGKIVDAQPNNQGRIDALAVIQNSACDQGEIYVNDAALSLTELPYAVVAD
ncbi:MAG TPA: folate-binding protein [Gammaproteobacteria bacterium]|nr:folate-binding protein [Gammaproteobacteria bacterium]